MSLENLRILLRRLTEKRAEVSVRSDEVSGTISFDRIAYDWQSAKGVPDDLFRAIAFSLFGPDDKGPVVELPICGGMVITLEKFVPGDSQEILGTVQVTNPDYQSDPARICCQDGEVCQVNGLNPSEQKELCQALERLRAENNGGLPILVVTKPPPSG
jgi:hypothetical protein